MALVRHYKFDDNAASTTLVATVGTNGTANGGDNTSVLHTTGPGGTITSALLLDGTNDYLAFQSITFNAGAAFSISLWVKYSTANTDNIIGRNNGGTPRVFRASSSTITVTGITGTPNTATFTVAKDIGDGFWHHLLITRPVTTNIVHVYLDGVESSSGGQEIATNFIVTDVGAHNASFINAAFAQLKIYDSEESANVATLYAEGVDDDIAVFNSSIFGGLFPLLLPGI